MFYAIHTACKSIFEYTLVYKGQSGQPEDTAKFIQHSQKALQFRLATPISIEVSLPQRDPDNAQAQSSAPSLGFSSCTYQSPLRSTVM